MRQSLSLGAILLGLLLVAGCVAEPPPATWPRLPPPAGIVRPLPPAVLPPLIIPERFIEARRPQRKPPAVRPPPPAAYRGAPVAVSTMPPAPRIPDPPPATPSPSPQIGAAAPEIDPGLPVSAIPALAGEPDPMLVPLAARPYQRTMLRESRAVWGMAAPTSLFGGQIQAESAWRPGAHSIYAAGLAQFIPATAEAMSRKYPELGGAEPLNPQWAIRALVRYDHDLYRPIVAASDCDRWGFALSAYNGGPGWISRDRALCRERPGCDPSRWWGHVEKYTGRSAANARENREYPRRIELQYQASYRSWGGVVQCRA